ncbi:MAG: D-aminoacylase [Clostridia bacterium]|nr:D-aminoacylase [Clostridia bacterium]
MFDFIIKNADIIDGTGSPSFKGDLAVFEGKIAAIAPEINGEAAEVIDAEGLTLAPGFIDIHSHSDITIANYPKAESRILQGVTTEITGNCGESMAPLRKERLDLQKAYMGDGDYSWESFGEYLDYLEKGDFPISGEKGGISVNFAGMVGHGTIRIMAMGFDRREATAAEMADMKAILADTVDQGAFGMTSGLIYPPGSFSTQAELTELCKVVAAKDVIYATHMRSESFSLEEALQEAIETAEHSGAKLQVSHFKALNKSCWFKADHCIEMVEAGRARGMDIMADQYPYIASSTGISADLPDWLYDGGIEEAQRKLKDPLIRARVIAESEEEHAGRWDTIVPSSISDPEFSWMTGHNMEENARVAGTTASELACRLVEGSGTDCGCVRYNQCEEVVERIMVLPYVMTGSDGSDYPMTLGGVPHPRNFGTFPRVLARYCRDRKLFSLETAVNKMTGMPAARVGLKQRGLLKEGYWADLVLFDAKSIKDAPTFEKPAVPCEGIIRVYVNGVLTAENGIHTGAKAGKVLRSGK